MKLIQKKIIAKELLVFVTLLILSSVIYFSFEFYDKSIRKTNAEISIKIRKIDREIKFITDSIQGSTDLKGAIGILKPWELYSLNVKQKIPTYSEVTKRLQKDNSFTPPDDAILLNPKKDSLNNVILVNQILKIGKQRNILESHLISNIDTNQSIKNSIIILLILVYPIRFLILGIIWSVKILKKNE